MCGAQAQAHLPWELEDELPLRDQKPVLEPPDELASAGEMKQVLASWRATAHAAGKRRGTGFATSYTESPSESESESKSQLESESESEPKAEVGVELEVVDASAPTSGRDSNGYTTPATWGSTEAGKSWIDPG